MNRLRRVSFHTLGCRLNQAETALIAERFRVAGYVIVEHGLEAEVAVINTCSVTEHADARCRQEIRKIRRRNPDALVCAVGCYAQADSVAVAAIPGVDFVVGNDRKFALVDLISQSQSRKHTHVHVSRIPDADGIEYPMSGYYPHQTRANIKVQDGCDFCCAFCILPRIRGRARSRPLRDIVAEGHELMRRGHKELVVTGVNIGTYEYEQFTLADVARSLSEIPGVERVRISSIEPSTISDDLLQWMADSPKACRYLHLPLQSGDDAVLSRMKRVYTTSEYAKFVERAKSLMPDLGLGTDVMVGFPGESEREFSSSLQFVESMPFSYLHVFSYSDRPKTASLYHDEKVKSPVVKERSQTMHDLASRKKEAFFGGHVGRSVDVLFETVDDDGWRKGFTGSYLRVAVAPKEARENTVVGANIVEVSTEFCLGQISQAAA